MITRDELFSKLAANNPWQPPCTFDRKEPIPLEKYSVFESLSDAQDYALASLIAYPGQPLAVITQNSIKFYLTSAHVLAERTKDPDAWGEKTNEQRLAFITDDDRALALIEVSTAADLAGEGDRVDELLEEIDEAIEALAGRMTTAESDIDTAEGDIDDLEGRMTTAESDIDALEGRANALEGRALALENKDKELVAKDEALEVAIAKALEDAKTYANGLNHFSTALVTDESEMTQENVLYLVKTEADGKDIYLEYLVMDVEGVKKPVCIGDTTTDLDNYYTKAQVNDAIDEDVKVAKEALEAQITTLSGTVESNKTALEGQIDDVADDLADEVTARTSEITRVEGLISANDTAIKANAADIEALESDVQTKNSNLVNEISRVDGVLASHKTRMDGIDTTISELDNKYATDVALDALAAQHTRELNTLNTDLTKLIGDEKERAEQAEGGLSERIAAVEEFKNKVPETYATKGEVNAVNSSLSDTQAELAAYKTSNNTAVQANKTAIETLETKHDTAVQTINKNVADNYVAKTVTVNGKALSSNVTVTLDELGGITPAAAQSKADAALAAAKDYTDDEIEKVSNTLGSHVSTAEATYVKKEFTLNKHKLEGTSLDLTPADIGADEAGAASAAQAAAEKTAKAYTDAREADITEAYEAADTTLGNTLRGELVAKTTKVNGKALSGDVTLGYADVHADQEGSAAQALTDAKAYADNKAKTNKEGYEAADTALSNRIKAIEDAPIVKYNTDMEFIIDCGNAAGEHPVYNA